MSGELTAGEKAVQEMKQAIGYAEVPGDGDDGGMDALIDYKNALEDRLMAMIDQQAAAPSGASEVELPSGSVFDSDSNPITAKVKLRREVVDGVVCVVAAPTDFYVRTLPNHTHADINPADDVVLALPVATLLDMAMSPQAVAIVAGMLDPKVRQLEQETGDSQVFATAEPWKEVETLFPVERYRERLNDEGEIE